MSRSGNRSILSPNITILDGIQIGLKCRQDLGLVGQSIVTHIGWADISFDLLKLKVHVEFDPWESLKEGGVSDTIPPPRLLNLELARVSISDIGVVSRPGFCNQTGLVRLGGAVLIVPAEAGVCPGLRLDSGDDITTESGWLGIVDVSRKLFEIDGDSDPIDKFITGIVGSIRIITLIQSTVVVRIECGEILGGDI